MKLKDMLQGGAAAFFLLALLILLYTIGPWLAFWSIGVLFDYRVSFTFWNWLAAVVLLGLVRGGRGGGKD